MEGGEGRRGRTGSGSLPRAQSVDTSSVLHRSSRGIEATTSIHTAASPLSPLPPPFPVPLVSTMPKRASAESSFLSSSSPPFFVSRNTLFVSPSPHARLPQIPLRLLLLVLLRPSRLRSSRLPKSVRPRSTATRTTATAIASPTAMTKRPLRRASRSASGSSRRQACSSSPPRRTARQSVADDARHLHARSAALVLPRQSASTSRNSLPRNRRERTPRRSPRSRRSAWRMHTTCERYRLAPDGRVC